jgi:dynein heavy chain, axonemal
LKEVDVVIQLLDEQVTMTQAMTFSSFKGPFEDDITAWDKTLNTVSELIDEWLAVQRSWLYLQPIFDSEDIKKQLPTESKRFANVNKTWRTTMRNAQKNPKAIEFCDSVKLYDQFVEGNKFLDLVQKGLSDYLETKRAGFSRFYFLSNDELLEILSETKNPRRVQPHLKKCFEAIKSVRFEEDLSITAMISREKEKVELLDPIQTTGKNVENWMSELEEAMCNAVRARMFESVLDYVQTPRTEWMQIWPGQCVLNGSQVLSCCCCCC